MDIDWLLACDEPWTRYCTLSTSRTRRKPRQPREQARAEMLAHPQVQDLIVRAASWPGHAIKRHNDTTLPAYALTTLADFGLDADGPGMDAVVGRVLASQSDEGAFQSLIQIPKAFGGSGEDRRTWMLCDSSPLLYALAAMGLANHPAVQKGLDHLMSVATEVGWSCCAAADLGKFRGPGKRGDPCPIAVLWGLKALTAANLLDTDEARSAVESLLSHYEMRGQKKFFLFGIGTDFHKLKYPFIWYDILHVSDALTCVPNVLQDRRLADMIAALTQLAGVDNRYTASSMYMAWRGWSFADKKKPSPWITFLAYRIRRRMDQLIAS